MAKVGDKIGTWTLRRRIGSGGQGEVFAASAGEGNENVAIKVIKVTRPKRRARFVTEIQIHDRLSKEKAPNVIPVLSHNLTELKNGDVSGYIVMPLAAGNLEEQLRLLRGRYDLCLEVFEGILVGIQSAHRAGVVHRDIKPANILFPDRDLRQPLIADFGICFLRETPESERVTDVGETVGAKYFMAPEQERGGRADVTPAADIYALGKLVHYMYTGRLVYREETADAFREEELEREPRLRGLMDQVIARTVVHEPQGRIQSVDELLGIVKRLRGIDPKSGGSTDVPDSPKIGGGEENREQALDTTSVQDSYDEVCELLEAGRTKKVALQFDGLWSGFKKEWESLHSTIKESPTKSREAAISLIHKQPGATGATLAIARTDAEALYTPWKRFVERVTRSSEGRAGYNAVFSVPHVQAGFLYIVASVAALRFESWGVLRLLLTEKFEWYYQSGRPLYSYGFSHTYFFHSDALGREASKTHDLYRELLGEPAISHILGLDADELMDTYLQADLVMCLRAAQLAERGEGDSVWPDFGRFHGHRVVRLLDRMNADDSYAKGILGAFGEPREQFFSKLPSRLKYLYEMFAGSNYWWSSIGSWEPR